MNIIEVDDPLLAMRTLMYQQPSEGVMEYVKSSMDNFYSNIVGHVDTVKEAATNLYNRFYSNDAISQSSSILESAGVSNNPYAIIMYNDNTYKNISPFMQQMVMLDPMMYQSHIAQEIVGFNMKYDSGIDDIKDSSLYHNLYSGVVTPEHDSYDYVDSADYPEFSLADVYTVHELWGYYRNKVLEDEEDITDL